MKRIINIPIYSTLSPKHRQIANLVIGGLVCVVVVLLVSGMLNGPEQVKGPAGIKGGPKPHPMSAQLPGENLDPKDVWIGGAQKDVARMHDDLRQGADRDRQRDEQQDRINKEVLAALKELKEAKPTPAMAVAATGPASGAAAASTGAPVVTGALQSKPSAMSAGTFPPQPRTGDRIPAPGAGAYPPGAPGRMGAGSFDAGYVAPPTLMHVALKSSAEGDQPKATVGTAARRVDSYLPVGFTRATILGGLAAPTGGQAQSNPVPAIFRLSDASILPNHFRAQVRDCMVIGEGFGDQSSERAYIRTTLLSCVMKDGHVLEVPIKGQVFGEDGMNGVMGKLVTKQGQILTNALLSGIASGLGQGLSAASTVTTTSALGTVSSVPTDAGSILKSSAGTGIGKALDRLSQYYISLAEKTFPVIEVLPGRTVDIVLTQGVQLDTTLGIAASGRGDARAPTRNDLLDVLHDEH
jgi:conjugal transfer pilus assembly protein TraB